MVDVTEKFEKAVQEWLASCQKMLDVHYRTQYKNLVAPTLKIAKGSKNWKIVKVAEGGGRSVFAFIEVATGDILKPAGWKAPAKHARGNLWDDTKGMGRMTVCGPEYLR